MTINLNDFQNIKALVIGDLMIDEYLWGFGICQSKDIMFF